MTNIWKDSFEEVRKPHFTIEDPYTLREKKEKEEKENKPKRWWDDDGDGVGYEKGEVSGKFKRKKKKVDEETLVEVDKAKTHNDKVDVKKGIHNKVDVNPDMKEQVEAWVGQLVEEGYDLSEFTWDEMFDIYESAEVEQLDEMGTAGMPAAGDAQTVTADPLSGAKARAARAKVAKERADFQVAQQQQRLKVNPNESFDSIVDYLSQRPNAFENLEEGVFDPKKSKMRPASQRSQNPMTNAQRTAAKKEAQRVAAIHSKGETVLAGLRPQGRGRVQTTPDPKPEAPAPNRKVKGRYDKLAAAAARVLKDAQK